MKTTGDFMNGDTCEPTSTELIFKRAMEEPVVDDDDELERQLKRQRLQRESLEKEQRILDLQLAIARKREELAALQRQHAQDDISGGDHQI